MSKKTLLFFGGILTVTAVSICCLHYLPQKVLAQTTYQYKIATNNTYHFQNLADSTSTSTLPAAGTWQADFPTVNDSNILGIAGQFNVFAENITNNTGHTLKGNFATQSLVSNYLFGTQGTSYLENSLSSDGNVSSSRADTLILGENLKYTRNLLWGRPGINDISLSTAPKSFRQDVVGSKYIDIDSEFARLSQNSRAIAMNTKDNQPDISGNQWSKVFDATNIVAQNNVKYLTVKASDMPGDGGQLDIKGISSNQQVVITIDTSGASDFTARYSETNGTDNEKILFNFYNFSENSNFTGTINWGKTTGNVSNAILAPNATVELGTTKFQGNIVAKNLINQTDTSTISKYPDTPLPSTTPTVSSPKLVSVPNVAFGTHNLQSETSLIGTWKGDFQVSGEKNTEIKINVALAEQLTSQTGAIADDVTWQLIESNYSSGTLVTSIPTNLYNGSANISYRLSQDGINNVLDDWNSNKQSKSNGFYDIQISNLNSVTEIGNYAATLQWTLVDSP